MPKLSKGRRVPDLTQPELTHMSGSVPPEGKGRPHADTPQPSALALTDILESITEGFVALDADWRFTYVNGTAERILQKRQDELLGKNHWDVYAEILGTQIEKEYRQAMVDRLARTFDFETAGLLFEIRVYPAKRGGLVIYFQDVTTRRRFEAALEQSEQRYRSLFETTRDGILIVNDQGRYVDVNDSYCQVLKASRERLIGAHFREFIPEARLEEAEAAFASLQRGGSTPLDFPLRALDGSIVELEWTSSSNYLPGLHVCACRDITDRKRIEKELQRGAEESRTLLAALPDVVSRFDRSLRFLYISPAVKSTTGLPPEHFLGRTHTEAGLPEEVAAQLRASLQKIFETGQQDVIEFNLGSPAGLQHFVGIGVPEIGHCGEVTSVLSIVREITKQKQAEEAVRSSEEQFRTLANSIPQFAWMAEPDGYIFWYNHRWYEYTGTTPEEMQGWGWQSVHDPTELPKVLKQWSDSISTGEPFDMVFPLRGADGVFRSFLTKVMPVRDAEGRVVRWFGTNTDIEDRKRAEDERKALLSREQEGRRTAERLNQVGPMLLAELDLQKLTQKVTDLATQLTGAQFGALFHNVADESGESYMLYTLSGVPCEAFAKFPMPRNTAVFGPTFRGEGVVRSEDITQDPRYGKSGPHYGMPKGHLPVRSYLAVPVVSRSREVLGGLFFGHGNAAVFTEQHERLVIGIAAQAAIAMDNARLFEQVRRERMRAEESNAALRRANSDLEQFAYSASHDLKEPLRMVSIYSQMLKKKYGEKLGPQADLYIRYTVQGANRMEQLVRDLLSYTQASSENRKPAAPLNAEIGLDSAISSLEAAIAESGASITYDSLPQIKIHRAHLEQLFQNLIGNAIKYRSEKRPQISVQAERHGGEWLFSVKDNGIGIDPQYGEQIFGIFKRLHTSEEYSGTGIGLAICQKIVQRYGGRIWVESQPGRGSVFFFTIPDTDSEEFTGHS